MSSFLKAGSGASLFYWCLAWCLRAGTVWNVTEDTEEELKMPQHFIIWPADSRPDPKPAKAIFQDRLSRLHSWVCTFKGSRPGWDQTLSGPVLNLWKLLYR